MLTRSHDSDGRLLHDCEAEDCQFSLDNIRRRPPKPSELDLDSIESLFVERFSLRWWEFRRRHQVRLRFLELAGRRM